MQAGHVGVLDVCKVHPRKYFKGALGSMNSLSSYFFQRLGGVSQCAGVTFNVFWGEVWGKLRVEKSKRVFKPTVNIAINRLFNDQGVTQNNAM